MDALFIKVLNISIAASWLILAVIAVRWLLKRSPRWITVVLWGIVALRLVMPFSIKAGFSLVPSAQTVRIEGPTAVSEAQAPPRQQRAKRPNTPTQAPGCARQGIPVSSRNRGGPFA